MEPKGQPHALFLRSCPSHFNFFFFWDKVSDWFGAQKFHYTGWSASSRYLPMSTFQAVSFLAGNKTRPPSPLFKHEFWGLNPGLSSFKPSTLPIEPAPQPKHLSLIYYETTAFFRTFKILNILFITCNHTILQFTVTFCFETKMFWDSWPTLYLLSL